MPVKTYMPLTNDQAGHGTNANNYTGDGFADEIAASRYLAARFAAVDIPRGSTINSAFLEMDISAKNATEANQYVYCDLYYHQITPSPPLVKNENLVNRSYALTIDSAGSSNSNRYFPWNTAGAAKQTWTWNIRNSITTITASANWPLSGYGAITLVMYCNSENGFLEVGWANNNTPWRLVVDYTPPATSDLYIPNLLEYGNCEFPNTDPTLYQWESNNVLGAFVPATLDRLAINGGGPTTAPNGLGSYVLRALAPTTGKTFINYKGMQLEAGVWHTFSVHVWVPTGAPDWRMESMFRNNSDATLVTTKNAWVRQSIQIMGRGRGQTSFFGISTGAAATGAGQYLYLKDAMLTRTDYLTPYWSGNSTAGTGRAYAFTSNQSGTGIAVMTTRLPTAAITSTMPDVSKTKASPATTFSYSDPNAIAQGAFQIQRRRVS